MRHIIYAMVIADERETPCVEKQNETSVRKSAPACGMMMTKSVCGDVQKWFVCTC